MTRPNVSARGLGIAEAALDFTRDALKQAGVEIEYGRALHLQSAAAEKFIRLEILWEAATLSVWRAAWLADQEEENNTEASVCKAKAGMAVREITQGCIELLGPIGASRQHLVEKWFRDCRITDIYEGTGEIQRLIIARALLGYGRKELKRATRCRRPDAALLHSVIADLCPCQGSQECSIHAGVTGGV
jgi:acyl-CoA dehydrogenase